MTEIRHIVFDIGRVLIHYDAELPFQRLIPDPAERKWFFENVCTSPWNIEQDRGRTWEEAEAELLASAPRACGKHPQFSPPLARDGAACL